MRVDVQSALHLWSNYAFRKRLLSCWDTRHYFDCFVASQNRQKKEFCFHPCPKADEASCDVIRKLFSFFLYKGQKLIMTSEKENKLYFMLWGISFYNKVQKSSLTKPQELYVNRHTLILIIFKLKWKRKIYSGGWN